jgi:hypothetical protein
MMIPQMTLNKTPMPITIAMNLVAAAVVRALLSIAICHSASVIGGRA